MWSGSARVGSSARSRCLGRRRFIAAADNWSGVQLCPVRPWAAGHHRLVGMIDQVKRFILEYRAVECDCVPMPLAGGVARGDRGISAARPGREIRVAFEADAAVGRAQRHQREHLADDLEHRRRIAERARSVRHRATSTGQPLGCGSGVRAASDSGRLCCANEGMAPVRQFPASGGWSVVTWNAMLASLPAGGLPCAPCERATRAQAASERSRRLGGRWGCGGGEVRE